MRATLLRDRWITPAVVFLAAVLAGVHTPAAAAPTPAGCRAAAEYSAARRGLSLLVIQNDRTIFEEYHNGHSASKTQKIYSGTKAFWTVAAIAAEQDGLLDLDERACETITEWQRIDGKRDITLRQLLNFTAGIDPGFKLHGNSVADRNAYAIRLPLKARPGTTFIYGPGQLQIFCEVLRRKLAPRRTTPWEYLDRRILHPIGLHELKYRKDSTGTPLLATGFELTARQWARFGSLILHNGSFNGRPVVAPDLVAQCFRGSRPNHEFGLGFWLNHGAGRGAREPDIEDMLELDWWKQNWRDACISRTAPGDLVACIGSEYQRLIIIPSMGLVVVRQGVNAKFNDATFLRLLLGN